MASVQNGTFSEWTLSGNRQSDAFVSLTCVAEEADTCRTWERAGAGAGSLFQTFRVCQDPYKTRYTDSYSLREGIKDLNVKRQRPSRAAVESFDCIRRQSLLKQMSPDMSADSAIADCRSEPRMHLRCVSFYLTQTPPTALGDSFAIFAAVAAVEAGIRDLSVIQSACARALSEWDRRGHLKTARANHQHTSHKS